MGQGESENKTEEQKNRLKAAAVEKDRKYAFVEGMDALYENAQDRMVGGGFGYIRRITGYDREEILAGTQPYGYIISRQSAGDLITMDLLSRGLTMEEIFDKDAKTDIKRDAAKTFNQLFQAVPEGEEEAAKKRIDDYYVKATVDALPKLREEVNFIHQHRKLAENPMDLMNQKDGYRINSMAKIMFDLNQEMDREPQRSRVISYAADADPEESKKDPKWALNQIKAIGAANAEVKLSGQIVTESHQLFDPDEPNIPGVISAALSAKMAQSMTTANLNGGKKQMIPGLDEQDQLLMGMQQSMAMQFYQEHLAKDIQGNYSMEDLANKCLTGELTKSIKIELDENQMVKSMTVLDYRYDAGTHKLTKPDGTDRTDNMDPEIKQRYMDSLKQYTKELLDTDPAYVLTNSKQFKDVREKAKELQEMLNSDAVRFGDLQEGFGRLRSEIFKYQESHNPQTQKLDDRQKKRLRIMDKMERLSELADKYEKHPEKEENMDRTTSKLDAVYIDQKRALRKEGANRDGIGLLREKTMQAVLHVQDYLKNENAISPEEQKSLVHDMKTITFARLMDVEKKRLGSGSDGGLGLVGQHIRKFDSEEKLDIVIDNTHIDGLEKLTGLESPSKDLIREMFGKGQVDRLIGKMVDNVKDDVEKDRAAKREAARREREAARSKKEAEKSPQVVSPVKSMN